MSSKVHKVSGTRLLREKQEIADTTIQNRAGLNTYFGEYYAYLSIMKIANELQEYRFTQVDLNASKKRNNYYFGTRLVVGK